MEKLKAIYYSKNGYWHGQKAIDILCEKSGLSKHDVTHWLKRQPIWQIYLPGPKYIPRPKIEEVIPNGVHQTDILYLPHDTVGRKTYKYCLCVIDVASRYKDAEPLLDKTAAQTTAAIEKIYKRGPLKFPNLIQVDAGKEFLGTFAKLMEKKKVKVRTATPGNHRQQGIVERFNRTLSERLFKTQYHEEIKNPSQRSTKWVKDLPAVIDELNSRVTRLTGHIPHEAILSPTVESNSSLPSKRAAGDEKIISSTAIIRYLYLPGELEGGRRRATDPIWSLTAHRIDSITKREGSPNVYKLTNDINNDQPPPARIFVREELLLIPEDTDFTA